MSTSKRFLKKAKLTSTINDAAFEGRKVFSFYFYFVAVQNECSFYAIFQKDMSN